MRRRIAVPLIAAIGIAPWLWFLPQPSEDAQGARLSAVIKVPRDTDWVGGLSGLEVTPDGAKFYLVTDRGHIARGVLLRTEGVLTGLAIEEDQPLVDPSEGIPEFPATDAEGIALGADGRIFVSFEHAHRILKYTGWKDPERRPTYTRAWGALSKNGGLEALAVDKTGTLFTLPEAIAPGAWEALVYKRAEGSKWEQPFTIPVEREFNPVGADFGPDGKLYLLERGLYPFGFYSRVRRMLVTENGVEEVEIMLETPLWRHGNLEGLAVWRDTDGAIRLTMVSDDNFLPFLPGDIVEYILDDRLANATD
jgi:hypothetical protein